MMIPKAFPRVLAVGLGSLALGLAPGRSQEVFSQIVGAIAIDVPARSDVLVSFPFMRSAAFRSSAASISGGTQVSFSDNPFTAGAFNEANGQATHFLIVESGSAKGSIAAVTSNTAGSIVLAGNSAAGLSSGDTVAIHPYWTLASAFPQGVGGREDSEPGRRSVELILPAATASAGNMIPDGIFYFSSGAWRQVGASLTASFDNLPIPPYRSMVVRNNAAADLKAIFYGEVTTAPIAIPLARSDNESLDNFVGIGRPLAVNLSELRLHDSGVFETTTDSSEPADLLLVYSLTASGKNKKPVASYYYFNAAWRKVGASASQDFNSEKVEPGMGLAVRKRQAGTNPQQLVWVNEWELPQ